MKNAYFELIKISWRYAEGRRFYYVLAYVFFVIANLIVLLEPVVVGFFFNHLQEHGLEDYKGALLILASYPALQVLFWVFHGTGRVIERTNAYYIVKNFRTDLFDTLTGLPLKWHKDNHSGGTMSRLGKASSALKSFSEEGFMYHEVIVKFLGSLVALFVISFYTGFVLLGFGLLAACVIFRFDKLLLIYTKQLNEQFHLYDATFYDYVLNMRTVITLRLEKLARTETIRRIFSVLPIWKKNAKVNEVKWFLLTMVLAFAMFTSISLYLYGQVSAGGVLLLGTLVALYEYVQRFAGVFYDLAWKYENLVHYSADIDSIAPIWRASKAFGVRKPFAVIPKDWKEISIEGLHFKYEDEARHKHTLKNICLKLRRGERIAFVGESGSGKSTMMSLLRGLSEPNRGQVFADGINLGGLRSLSDSVTLIPQDPEIFENTIEYNITAGLRHKKSEVDEVVKMARFDTVLRRLSGGLKTNIKEKGVNLSGGEKQRLALARGLFAAKKSSIVLLDEPTSSVDPANELGIYDNIFGKFKDKCLVSSIHRLHLLPKFDRIYLFQSGVIVAEGTFSELMKKSPDFKKALSLYRKAKNSSNSDLPKGLFHCIRSR